MDDSSLLAGNKWPEEKDAPETEVCTGCVNCGRALDVVCGLGGALLLLYGSACAPLDDAEAYVAGCLPGQWYIAIIAAAAAVFCRPLHVAAREAPRREGDSPVRCGAGRAVDVACGVVAAAALGYGGSCSLSRAVAAREGSEAGIEAACLPNAWWLLIVFVALVLMMRPLWSLWSKACPAGSLYRYSMSWRWCCGCSWVFPLLVVTSFASITIGHWAVNTTVFGVTGGVRANATESSFWRGVQDNWDNEQYFTLALAIIFNVVILYICLALMLFSWFSSWRRGAIVTVVSLLVKWSAFHQYSNIISAISLAFEIRVPLVAMEGTWLEAVAGNGVLYTTLGLILSVSLAEVLLYTYAHGPRARTGEEQADGHPWGNSGPRGSGSSSDSGSDSGRRSLSRRASAAQIGYSRHSLAGERPQSLFMRVHRRRQQERNMENWSAVAGESSCPSCSCSGPVCSALAQARIPFSVVGFFICLYIATFSSDGLEFDFVTAVPCIPILGCPTILPDDPTPAPDDCLTRLEATRPGAYSACGVFKLSLGQLYLDIWDSKVGYQHALTPCEEEVEDSCPDPGPACYEGFCQPGPIILNTNRVFAFLLTLGPIFVLPQLQVLLCAVVWFVPMKVRTMAHCILALHMCLAWSTLDVWTVTLAVRITDLERYSLTAQDELCQDLGETLPGGVPGNVCFGALGFLGTGFWWMVPASILQWVASVYVSYEGAGVIIDQVRRSASLTASPIALLHRCLTRHAVCGRPTATARTPSSLPRGPTTTPPRPSGTRWGRTSRCLSGQTGARPWPILLSSFTLERSCLTLRASRSTWREEVGTARQVREGYSQARRE